MTIFLGLVALVTLYGNDSQIRRKALTKEKLVNTPDGQRMKMVGSQWTSGPDTDVEGRCVIIEHGFNGLRQWGNGVYYYLLALMYLVEKGAHSIVMPPKAPLGVIGLEDTVFHPLRNGTEQSEQVGKKCVAWSSYGIALTLDGTMQDLIDFRARWPSIMGKIQPNPFRPDFGVVPSMEDASGGMGVPWGEVVVLHIRQGDVMEVANTHGIFIHMQPPCSYYEDVVETGFDGKAFPYVLIITNKQEDPVKINPCASYIEERYGSGKYPTKLVNYEEMFNQLSTTSDSHTKRTYGNNDLEGMQKDLFILSQAINLGEGHSTFTAGAILLNDKLRRHFVAASPATINSVRHIKKTLDGRLVNSRQFYSEDVIQTQYLLPGWLDHDASCMVKDPHSEFVVWKKNLSAKFKIWKTTNTMLMDKMLEYPRSKLVKYVTTNEPFRCDAIAFSQVEADMRYAPCICDTDIE